MALRSWKSIYSFTCCHTARLKHIENKQCETVSLGNVPAFHSFPLGVVQKLLGWEIASKKREGYVFFLFAEAGSFQFLM